MHAMMDFLEVLAVREAVELQPPVRRRICKLLMRDYTRGEIARELGCTAGAVHKNMQRLRESFRAMGFGPPPRRRQREAAEETLPMHVLPPHALARRPTRPG